MQDRLSGSNLHLVTLSLLHHSVHLKLVLFSELGNILEIGGQLAICCNHSPFQFLDQSLFVDRLACITFYQIWNPSFEQSTEMHGCVEGQLTRQEINSQVWEFELLVSIVLRLRGIQRIEVEKRKFRLGVLL